MTTMREAMGVAIDAARQARGVSSPNPPVGAVILDADGEIVGRGHTAPVGGPHAEVVALAAAGDRARGGVAVVTLEPCNHQGRTGPCAQALIEAGISEVHFAVHDPNPVAAHGAQTLRDAGIVVSGGVEELTVRREILREWLFRATHGRPMVTAKIASTLDGRTGAPDGSSQWITGPNSRSAVHRDRAELDAIIVGTGTVVADDPSLTARDDEGNLGPHQPLRVVMGTRSISESARVWSAHPRTLVIPTHDPRQVLARLDDCVNVQVEGGPTVLGAFFAAGLVDRIQAYIAPTVLGAGQASVAEPTVHTLADAYGFFLESVDVLGNDVRVTCVKEEVNVC